MRTFDATSTSLLGALAFLSLAPGCDPEPATAMAAHRADRGTVETYAATFDEAWRAAHVALQREGVGPVEDHLDDHSTEPFFITYQPGSRPPGVVDQIGVWFLPEGPRRTLVKVIVMTGIEATAGLVGPDELSVQRDIASALAAVRREEQALRADPASVAQ